MGGHQSKAAKERKATVKKKMEKDTVQRMQSVTNSLMQEIEGEREYNSAFSSSKYVPLPPIIQVAHSAVFGYGIRCKAPSTNMSTAINVSSSLKSIPPPTSSTVTLSSPRVTSPRGPLLRGSQALPQAPRLQRNGATAFRAYAVHPGYK